MEFVMTIGDATVIPKIGFVIVGGNPEITKEDVSKLCRIGENIMIKSGKEELLFKVLDISLSCSLSEKITISMKLEQSDHFGKLKCGDLVYKNYKLGE